MACHQTVYPPEGDEPLPTEAWRDPFGPDCRWDSVVTQRGRYRIRVEYVGPEADMIFYVTVRQHREISMGNTYRGQFGQQGNDRYEFTMASAGRVILESGAADLNCGGNTWFTLYRMDRGEDVFVELDGNGAGGNCSRIDMRLFASRYALVVRETRDGALADYFLRFRGVGRCGDGVLNVDEECDDGNANDEDEYSVDCQRQAVCGNGRTEIGETCDDGNRVSGDGCSDECQGEILCGNGRLDAREECDDGNEIVGDGCDQLCSLEDYEIIVGQTTIVGEFSLGGFDRFRFHADGPSQLEIFTYVDTPFHVDPVRTRC